MSDREKKQCCKEQTEEFRLFREYARLRAQNSLILYARNAPNATLLMNLILILFLSDTDEKLLKVAICATPAQAHETH